MARLCWVVLSGSCAWGLGETSPALSRTILYFSASLCQFRSLGKLKFHSSRDPFLICSNSRFSFVSFFFFIRPPTRVIFTLAGSCSQFGVRQRLTTLTGKEAIYMYDMQIQLEATLIAGGSPTDGFSISFTGRISAIYGSLTLPNYKWNASNLLAIGADSVDRLPPCQSSVSATGK